MCAARALLLSIAAASTIACTTDDDCALNGACVASACVCSQGWAGPACGALKLAPAPLDGGYNVVNTSSWGGAPLVDADGVYHMYLAEFINHCGLESWHQNSRVVHATSTNAVGPFVFVDEVIPAYSHNPTVAITDGGALVLMHIGGGTPDPSGPPLTCRNGSSSTNYSAPEPRAAAAASSSVGTLCADDFAGPWRSCNWTSGPQTGFTNPTLFATGDGLIVGGNRNYSLGLTHGANCSRTACANWTTPVNVLPNRTGEDPWIWRDANNHWHALLHDMSPDLPAGRHAFSRDGLSWSITADLAYDGNITFADGSRVAFSKRERPHLLLDPKTRAPLALSTGVMQHPEHLDDHSWTCVQAVLP